MLFSFLFFFSLTIKHLEMVAKAIPIIERVTIAAKAHDQASFMVLNKNSGAKSVFSFTIGKDFLITENNPEDWRCKKAATPPLLAKTGYDRY
jgi:hypothetical protein